MPTPNTPPTPTARARLAAPAAAAALLPVASRVAVWLAAPERALLLDPGALLFQALWTATPFVLVAGLAATTASLRPAFGLAAGAGLTLTAAGWGWATWGRVRVVTGQTSGGVGVDVGTLMLMLPVAAVSVMVTVIAVRGAFAGGPTRR